MLVKYYPSKLVTRSPPVSKVVQQIVCKLCFV
jgi:hypothetical protein